MYVLLLLLGLAGFGWLLVRGLQCRSRWRRSLGWSGLAVTILFFPLLSFWGEMLWFEALGFSGRFWSEVYARIGLASAASLVGVAWAWLWGRSQGIWTRLGVLLSGLWGAWWGYSNWDLFLRFRHGAEVGQAEPILGRDVGFYLFWLPFYDAVFWLLMGLALLQLGLHLVGGMARIQFPKRSSEALLAIPGQLLRDRFSSGALLLVLGWGMYLSRFHVLYSKWGAVSGPGWVDVHARLPAFAILALASGLIGLWLLVDGFRRRRWEEEGAVLDSRPAGLVLAALAGLWLIGLLAIPGLLQALMVEPNEITYERPYIQHNIEFTRRAFALDNSEDREFPASGQFTERVAQENRNLLGEVRLWDWRALKAVHKQFQEIRLYYEFNDVDIDRYRIGGRYRQVMISAREMEVENLPVQSQTFVNQRFKYTHGYGLTMTPVSEFTPQGLPNFLVRDIPPQAEADELQVTQPQIYYGELTTSPVYVNTSEEEFDYPSGDQNVYFKYDGTGGVELSGLWRKLVFGWKFDGTKFFFSSYPGPQSRILFHREVRERVQTLAPFLQFDDDPYCVLHEGRLFWIIDGFTSSDYYPYAEPFSSQERISFSDGDRERHVVSRVSPELHGANYTRNSVKAVIDAFHGTVSLYVFEPDDALIQVWQRIFPNLFSPASEMPPGLRQHIRYPVDLLLAQGLVYAKYHMEDPEVFYNQEDLWVRATEKYLSAVQPVEPYYVMWELPDSDQVQFVLIQPFTPKNRQVLIGWMAGMCDGDDYGRLLVYKFPKEKRIVGPQQVETKIDQDRFLSGQLTLWDQRGSQVIRGNVLAIPIGESLLYVEPIYLQAETAAYPELRLVAAMQGDRLSYADNLEAALRGLFESQSEPEAQASPGASVAELARQASRAFELYLELQGESRFREAAEQLERLQVLLQRLAEATAPGETGTTQQ